MISNILPSTDYWHKHCDPRTLDQWLMQNGPMPLVCISMLYLLMIVVGRRLMKHRHKPYNLRMPMFLFNVCLVMVNAYFFYKSFWWTNYLRDLLNFRYPSAMDRSPKAMEIIRIYYYYQLSKFLDYVDTAFLILRKKYDHITPLHVYHHASVPIVGWISNWCNPTMPVLGMFAMLNSFCHVLMYTYYALCALGPKLRPYLWWKSYITIIQLIQFTIIGLYGLVLSLKHENYPLLYRATIISQAAIYLVMFGNFYIRNYCHRETSLDAAATVKNNNKTRTMTNHHDHHYDHNDNSANEAIVADSGETFSTTTTTMVGGSAHKPFKHAQNGKID